MNAALIQVVLQAILGLLQGSSFTSTAVQNVLTALDVLIPVIIKEYNDLLPMVKNIITALKSSDALTDQQLADAEAQDAKVDAAFEAAVAAYDASNGDSNG